MSTPPKTSESVRVVEISPGTGAYPSPVAVSLSCAIEGAEIRYTLDGSEPDDTSPLYNPDEGLLLTESAVIRTRAYKEGYEPSAVNEAAYEVSAPAWQEKEPEDHAETGMEETRSDTQDLDSQESEPEVNASAPGDPETLKPEASQTAEGPEGRRQTISEEIQSKTTEPTEAVGSPSAKSRLPVPVSVSLSCAIEGAEIRYTLDGSEPDDTSPLYNPDEGLLLTESAVIRTRAYKEGYEPSAVNEAAYEVSAPAWQEKEPEDRADEVAHEMAEEAQSDGWKVAGASVRGKLHAHRALWRDDSFAFDFTNGWTTIVVSDGVGSAPLSRVGSRLACDHALSHLQECLKSFTLTSESIERLKELEMPRLREFLVGAAGKALQAIRHEASARSQSPGALGATLLVFVQRAWGGKHLVAAIQVGDGSVALLDWDGNVDLLGRPDHGEYAGEARFLTTQGIEATFWERVIFSIRDRLRCVAVMSDGVSDDFFPEEKRMVELFLGEELPHMTARDGGPMHGVLRTVTPAHHQAQALLEWLRYEKRGSSDDRTLVLAWAEK